MDEEELHKAFSLCVNTNCYLDGRKTEAKQLSLFSVLQLKDRRDNFLYPNFPLIPLTYQEVLLKVYSQAILL